MVETVEGLAASTPEPTGASGDYVRWRLLDRGLIDSIEIVLRAQPDPERRLRVLDIGTSLGIVPLVLAEAGAEVATVDLPDRRDTIDHLQAAGIDHRALDLEEGTLPFEDRAFDVVIFKDVIEHLPFSPKGTLAEINRVLRPGGLCYLSSANVARLSSRLRLLVGKTVHPPLRDFYDSGGSFRGHHREFTLREMRALAKWAGFEIDSARRVQQSETLFLVRNALRYRRNAFLAMDLRLVAALLMWNAIARVVPSVAQIVRVVARKPGPGA